jgi:2-furoate---CoA ligase
VSLHRLRPDRRRNRAGVVDVNLALSLLAAAERTPDAEAVVDGDERLTYAELRRRAARVAGGLAARGLAPGDRVAAIVRPRRETVELYWAAQWLGVTFVPLSHRVSEAEIEYCREDSGAALLLEVDADVDALAEEEHPGALGRDEREESLMLYTSGTTGRPKGVPRSHRADRAGGLSQVLQHGYRFGDRTLGVMPLYHTMGVHSLIAMHLVGGCYVCQPDWDAGEALRLIERERITSLYLAPTLYYDVVHHPEVRARDLSSIETLAYAGAAMTSALVERCVEAFRPRRFVNHYGSTEIYTFSVHLDQATKPGCAGRPSLNARLRLDEQGEILCHMDSDEAFAGYWNRPDADEKAIHDGWYRTGDVGMLDEEGDLWLLGRVDDMIVSGGENVHPLEVEDVLSSHPAVAEVAVVGAADERLGHRVVAYVVAADHVTADELDGHCLASATLARFKRPREYRFVEALPKSPSGKVLRRLLREEAAV